MRTLRSSTACLERANCGLSAGRLKLPVTAQQFDIISEADTGRIQPLFREKYSRHLLEFISGVGVTHRTDALEVVYVNSAYRSFTEVVNRDTKTMKSQVTGLLPATLYSGTAQQSKYPIECPVRQSKLDVRFSQLSDTYLANSCMASSARTPPVIVIGTNGVFAATSALEIMI
jgi:hypothetical protein